MPGLATAPWEFILFGATLFGVAVLHRQALTVALAGLVAIAAYKLMGPGLAEGPGLAGLAIHLSHEWVTLANLMLLLVGFAVLAHHFEESRLPHALPRFLPQGWVGALALLAMVFCMSAVLDNIAAAVIGGVMARHVYGGRVGVGFVASIVAAANAGGAGSVIGDTTTTMMWLHGVSPLAVAPAYIGSLAAFAVFGVLGALSQARQAPAIPHDGTPLLIDWSRAAIVAFVLVCIIGANVVANSVLPGLEETIPLLGIAVWVALLISLFARRPDWSIAPRAAKGALFLVALVAGASFMPVDTLPPPTAATTFGLGLVSSLVDNIPLTALALKQGGYDWPLLAYAMGLGGSMIWFGTSAGVALSGLYPEARSMLAWLRQGWHIPLAYVVGFGVLWAIG